jgi:epidermal growth factor receptor substrate 15
LTRTYATYRDLADLNNDGRLTRDGFAVAMHLIQKKLAGGDIPPSLPPSLIPPSLRQVNAGVSSPFSPVQAQQPPPQQDLFSFDETPLASATPSNGAVNISMQNTDSQQHQQQLSGFVAPSNFASPSLFASPSASQDPFTSPGTTFINMSISQY